MSDSIATMLADGWVARHGTGSKQETATEWLVRTTREARQAALDRALFDLKRGYEARQADIDVFAPDGPMHLRYLDARDEALGIYGEELAWQPEPDPEPDPLPEDE